MFREDIKKALEKTVKPKEEQRETTKKTIIFLLVFILFLLVTPFALILGLSKNYRK